MGVPTGLAAKRPTSTISSNAYFLWWISIPSAYLKNSISTKYFSSPKSFILKTYCSAFFLFYQLETTPSYQHVIYKHKYNNISFFWLVDEQWKIMLTLFEFETNESFNLVNLWFLCLGLCLRSHMDFVSLTPSSRLASPWGNCM